MRGLFHRKVAVIVALLAALAFGMRLYSLGDWSFAHDELATIAEDAALFGDPSAVENTHTPRLPRLIPVSYAFLHVGFSLFGTDEFGSRIVPALFGTASVALVFLLLDGLMGTTVAVTAAVLVALWPEHLFQSQQTRFYTIAMFFSAACLLFGARALERRSARDAIAASVSGIIALLSHTVAATALLIAIAGFGLGTLARRERMPKGVLAAYGLALAAVLLLGGLFVLPMVRGWNAGESWGYPVNQAVLVSLHVLSWPFTVMSAIGMVLMARRQTALDLYWLTAVLGWGTATLVLPTLVVYHPGYVFPLAVSALIPAAIAIDRFAAALLPQGRPAAVACVALCCLLNLPSVASYYVDGSRHDWRAATEFVQQHWKPGDRVTSTAHAFIRHYAPDCTPRIPLSIAHPVESLELLIAEPWPLWVVLPSNRGGLDPELKTWLRHRCVYEAEFAKSRFDYGENRVDVYRCAAP